GDEAAEYLRKRGIRALDPDQALLALARAVDGGDICVTVADVDWDRFVPAFTAARPSPLLTDLVRTSPATAEGADMAPPAVPGGGTEAQSGLRKRLAGLPDAEQDALLSSVVSEAVAVVLGHTDAGAVDVRRPFSELGFDSLMAVELRDRLGAETGLGLPASVVFDHPTPADLVRRLRDELGPVSGTVSFLAGLDALEAEFSATPPDGLTRAKMAVRLQAFLSRWADGRPSAAGDPSELEDASDEEMLSLIDRELGL
ncbi:phosphopantetheine-binding protein, partial [Streptomyces sp. ACA25]|uniref:phosphopantetheine-binding protein n=1 Tax=Streptomyces sp. ACA25 TaxID=3022596 RepID=UPI002307858B